MGLRLAGLLMLGGALAGCSSVPLAPADKVVMGPGWLHAGDTSATTVVRPADWWTLFDNDTLNKLVLQALAHNNDVEAAVQRVAQARGQAKVAGASVFPTLSAGASAGKNLDTGNGDWSVAATSTLAYEADLFGGNRASRKAARAGLDSAVYAQAASRLLVAGDVATQYFNLLALIQREELAGELLEKSQKTLDLIRARSNAGTVAPLDAVQQQALVAQQRVALAALSSQRVAAETALAVLLGQAPNVPLEISTAAVRVHLPEIAADTPARVLLNRPDVQQAEANLRAAAANVDAARAALFPTLNLSLALQAPIDPASMQTSLGASLLAPIFEGGRLRGALFTSKARQRELVATYRTTVLTALKEVEDALAAATATSTQLDNQALAAQAASLAARIAEEKFKVGTLDMPTLLDTQRSELSARDSLIQARVQALVARITLIKALGGGQPI